MSFWVFLFVPTILFIIFVAPIWIVAHYRAKGRETSGLNQAEQASLDNLLATLDKLTERVDTLEEILDKQHPEWQGNVAEKQ